MSVKAICSCGVEVTNIQNFKSNALRKNFKLKFYLKGRQKIQLLSTLPKFKFEKRHICSKKHQKNEAYLYYMRTNAKEYYSLTNGRVNFSSVSRN